MSLRLSRSAKATSMVVAICFLTIQVTCFLPSDVFASNKDDLKNIEYKYYFRGNYDKAISELKSFLERKHLSKAETVEAREYLAASLIMTGASTAGKEQYLKLLKMDSAYKGPDPGVFKPMIVSTFEEAKAEYASAVIRNVPDDVVSSDGATTEATETKDGKPIYKKWWFYVGIGAALLIVAGAASGGGGGGDVPPETGSVTVGVDIQ